MRRASTARSWDERRSAPGRWALAALVVFGAVGSRPGDVAAQPSTGRPATVSYRGGDGRTCDDPVVIVGARNSQDGIAAEYRWVALNRPGASVATQALVRRGDRSFDVLTLKGGDGGSVCFDITGFFGVF